MAGTAAATVLQLPHHGRPRDVFRAPDGSGGLSSVAGKVVSDTLGALAADVEFPAALHRKHGRLDDRGNRPAAVGCLRPDSHVRGLFQIRLSWERIVYSSGIYGNVQRSFHALHCSGLSNRSKGTSNCPRAGCCANEHCLRCGQNESCLALIKAQLDVTAVTAILGEKRTTEVETESCGRDL